MSNDSTHPGAHIRRNVLPEKMTVAEAAKRLGVGRPALSNMLNGNAALSPEMAMRFEKAFGADSKTLLELQAEYDRVGAKAKEPALAVRSYASRFLDITAAQIEAGFEGIAPRADLSVFLRRLVKSTAQQLSAVDFPGGDNSQRHGWDGWVEAGAATAWVPLGMSGWEFGCNQDPLKKAEADYLQRTKLPTKEREETTFVFVTPRNWPGKNLWVAEKKKLHQWKDVRAFDASDLEQWLEESIPAQAWLAERLPMGSNEIASLDWHWQNWAGVTVPELDKHLFSRAADATRNKFAQWLSAAPSDPFTVTAESAEEGLAFLACLLEGEKAGQTSAYDSAIVLSTAGALIRATNASTNFLPILVSDEAQRVAGNLATRQHTIVVTRRNAVEGDPSISLDIVDDATFSEALERMGKDRDEIDRLRHETGHSLTVLRRRLAQLPALKVPSWAEDLGIAGKLIPFTFLGAWDSKNEADRTIVSELADRTYEKVEATIVALWGTEQSPVWTIGSLRGLVSKVDSMYALGRLITADDFNRFFRLAQVVLSEEDPSLELPEDKRWAASIYGKTRKHSGALRLGICETLVFLAVHGNNLFRSRGLDVEAQVNALIKALLMPLTGASWESQDSDLPRYAEAAPEIFLAALEDDLRADTPQVLSLLRSVENGAWSSPSRTGLMWALETLAWNPKWFSRVVAITARLAEVPITDNWMNRPSNTLDSIFRAWMPQTAAPIEQRKKALEYLAQKFPTVGWEVCVAQFGAGHSVGHYNSKPRWRNDALGAGEPRRDAGVYEFARKALDLAIDWSVHTEATLGDLVDQMGGLLEADQSRIWKAIEAWVATDPGDTKISVLRERIRKSTLSLLGQKKGARLRKRARAVYERLAPKNVVDRHRWLFLDQWVHESTDEIEDDNLDWKAREKRVEAQRKGAVEEIWGERGIEGIIELLDEGNAAGTVGWILAGSGIEDGQKDDIPFALISHAGADERKIDDCISGFLWGLGERRLAVTSQALTRLQRENASGVVRFLRCAPFDASTWSSIDDLSDDQQQEYWKTVSPRPSRDDAAEIKRFIEEFLKVDRPRIAFAAARHSLQYVESDLLVRLLNAVGTSTAEHGFLPSAYDISEALDEIDKRSEISREMRVRLEFLFIRGLDHTKHGMRNLEFELAQSPTLFVQLVAMIFRRKDDREDPPELKVDDQEQASARASAAYTLLSHARRTPGTDEASGLIDPKKLVEWITTVKALGKEFGRETMTEQSIGGVLARSPVGPTGDWPLPAVREALEAHGTNEMLSGIVTGLFNDRGVVWRGEGGSNERSEAAKYQKWLDNLDGVSPFTERLLTQMIEMCEQDAKWHDERAEVSKRINPSG